MILIEHNGRKIQRERDKKNKRDVFFTAQKMKALNVKQKKKKKNKNLIEKKIKQTK